MSVEHRLFNPVSRQAFVCHVCQIMFVARSSRSYLRQYQTIVFALKYFAGSDKLPGSWSTTMVWIRVVYQAGKQDSVRAEKLHLHSKYRFRSQWLFILLIQSVVPQRTDILPKFIPQHYVCASAYVTLVFTSA